MTRPLHIPLCRGLPDAGATGQWLGRDRHGAVYTLRWMPEKQCWGALGWRANHPKPWPELVLLQGEQEGFIVGHVEGPAITAEAQWPMRLRGSNPRVFISDELHQWPEHEPAPRKGFFGAALADLVRSDRHTPIGQLTDLGPEHEPDHAPAWSPWFWTVAMLFGLPALVLALVFLAAHAPNAGNKPAEPGQSQERPHG